VLGIFTLGFRHGFDVDHVAAITDISGSQYLRLRAFLLSTVYALGHAVTVVALGLGIAWAGWDVPDASRLIGLTLVVLGGYVLWCAATHRRPTSRAGLAGKGLAALRDRLQPTTAVEHDHPHDHDGLHHHDHAELVADADEEVDLEPAAVTIGHRHRHRHEDLRAPYGAAGALGVGMIHGIGAETPTQVLALAAGTASLPPFLIGLFVGNTVVAVVAAIGLTDRRLRSLNALVGVFSIYVGGAYLLGVEPPLVG
jgi:high-affinity nickel-transport protein